jgi:protein-tyrosine phosphatase
MPFGDFDPAGEILHAYRQEKISVVVLLAEEAECLQRTGLNLLDLYSKKGFEVIHLPISDFSVPSKRELEAALRRTLQCAQAGLNIVIHCHAGIGRTGLFAAFFAKHVLGLSGKEAINWVRNFIPGAAETDSQRRMILDGDGNH